MNRLQEFWYCVAAQDDLPLHKGHNIESNVCSDLISFIEFYKTNLTQNQTLDTLLSNALLNNPEIINHIRLLVGVSDKRLYLDLTYLTNVFKDNTGKRLFNYDRKDLTKHTTSFYISQLKNSKSKGNYAKIISEYFIQKGLQDILDTFATLDTEQITQIFNNLIAPKEIQQMQAKYRGHSAEMEFSKIFNSCGMNIFPENKHQDPMATHDPNVDLSTMTIVRKDKNNANIHSFDLIIKDERGNIRILVQSLIHSSDPGQYGVNKSDETIDIMKLIKDYNSKNPNKKVYLLGSIDGVGFCENVNGTVAKMINVFDDFFQVHTLFKIAIFLQKEGFINIIEGIFFDKAFFELDAINHFENKYLNPIGLKNITNINSVPNSKCLKAGKATIVFK